MKVIIQKSALEVTYSISPNTNYIRRTGDYHMENAKPSDWDWDVEEVISCETGCPVDEDVLSLEDQTFLINYWKDNYDPTP